MMKKITTAPPMAVEAGFFEAIDKLKDVSVKTKNVLKKELETQIHHVRDNLHTTTAQAVLAFREPKPQNILKAVGYSFGTLYSAFHMAHMAAEEGALHLITHLVEHEGLHKAAGAAGKHGMAKKIDEFVEKYPVLKKVTGPALAGMMLYGYAMTEAHNLGDWNLANVGKALTGDFDISEFLGSKEAVALTAHVVSGKALSLSALAENAGTLAIGLACTAIIHSEHPQLKKLGENIADAVNKFRAKGNGLNDLAVPEKALKKAFDGDVPDFGVASKPDDPEEKAPKKDVDDKKVDSKDDKPEEKPLKAPKGKSKWWNSLSKGQQQRYAKEHPNSQMASVIGSTLDRLRSE
jgi:hypothetical protein